MTMSLGVMALLLAGVGAGWLVFRLARSEDAAGRNVTVLKIVIWFALAAALFAAKLAPLAFMVLLAAACVTVIEIWRAGEIAADKRADEGAQTLRRAMTADEAAAALGVSIDADEDAIKAAHKKLIAQIHPDKGGTNYLAAKINEARDFLLSRAAGRE